MKLKYIPTSNHTDTDSIQVSVSSMAWDQLDVLMVLGEALGFTGLKSQDRTSINEESEECGAPWLVFLDRVDNFDP